MNKPNKSGTVRETYEIGLFKEKIKKRYNMVNFYIGNWSQPSLEDLYRFAEILDVEIDGLLVKRKD